MTKKKQQARRKTTAKVIAVPKRSTSQVQLVIHDPTKRLPKPVNEMLARDAVGALGDEAAVGNLGMVEVRLTEQEEAVLARPVDLDDVLIKPDGVPYLPHAVYTKWFNASFGRLGWAIVPKARPAITDQLVTVPYVLYIHGQPVAFAIGEQDYHAGNRRQTFGDAVEATVASALRRCAKRLGVGLELWDKNFLADFMETRCVQVNVRSRSGEVGPQWRRATDRPLPFEMGVSSRRNVEPDTVEPKRVTVTQQPSDTITQQQRQRLAMIAKKAGRNEADVRLWLQKRWGVNNSKEIKRQDYERVCAALEAKGPLPLPGDGE